jgi:hypothetical protein
LTSPENIVADGGELKQGSVPIVATTSARHLIDVRSAGRGIH